MAVYLLNAQITPINWEKDSFAIIKMEKINLEKAKEILKKEGFISAIGHAATAELLSKLLETEVKVNRIEVKLERNDKAICFILNRRLGEGEVINSIEELEKIGYKLILIERIY